MNQLLSLFLLFWFAPFHNQPTPLPDQSFVVRAYYQDRADISYLLEYDLWEYHNLEERYLLLSVDAAEYKEILKLNRFELKIDYAQTAALNTPHLQLPNQISGIPGFPCYRTVEETFGTIDSLLLTYPELTTAVDIGDSWEKVTFGTGYDLRVLQLSNKTIPGPKPILFISAGLHAREYTPPELSLRFAEYLLTNYNSNGDARWLLDYHEIHILFLANPDGRKHAETGVLWRKNTNQTYCSPTSNSRGADLNRNFSFKWNECTTTNCSSNNQCSAVYRGPTAASEPETVAIETYLTAIFPDQRGTLDSDPAPLDTSGIYLDLHSAGGLIIWPWGFTYDTPPNTTYPTLGRKLAFYNGYTPYQIPELYPADGSGLDFAYGELGIASLAYEIGTTFFQSCSSFETTVLPDNLDSLLYAAKAAHAPYLIPSGPNPVDITLSAQTIMTTTALTLTVTIDDTQFNLSNGTEPTQTINQATYSIDQPPWLTMTTQLPLSPTDGAFDQPVENSFALLDTSALTVGQHLIYTHGEDATGAWGIVSAIYLTVVQNIPLTPTLTAQITDLTDITLSWPFYIANCSYTLFEQDTDPYFMPTPATEIAGPLSTNTLSYLQFNRVGDPGTNYYYLLHATGCPSGIVQSNRVGIFDFTVN